MYNIISSAYIIAPIAICDTLTCSQWPERWDTTFTLVSQCKMSPQVKCLLRQSRMANQCNYCM